MLGGAVAVAAGAVKVAAKTTLTSSTASSHTITLGIVAGSIFAVCIGILVVRYPYHRATPWYVYIGITVGYMCAFSVVILLPLDIDYSMTATTAEDQLAHQETMAGLWELAYNTTLIWAYLCSPIMNQYSRSGWNTIGLRLKDSLSVNGVFYGTILTVVTTGIVTLALMHKIDITNIYGILIALANTWGLVLLVSLLAWGLVDIPRQIWKSARPAEGIERVYQ
ncbi:LMBR1-like membrane protein, partial [Kipferlia bialata]|eukprot:g10211.t1